MRNHNQVLGIALAAVFALGAAAPAIAHSQTAPQRPAAAPAPSEQEVAEIQSQFLKLLRLSPVLTSVVARDPSLLSDPAYVERNNPELAAFMAAHPDIAKNPDFYLFNHLRETGDDREQALERTVWPDMVPQLDHQSSAAELADKMIPMVVVITIFTALVLIVRFFVESRRWSRTFKMQSEVHSRLIDKFSTSQELAAYMETEAGKRFLEAAPISTGVSAGPFVPNVVARVLTPLQIGLVMVLLGIGFLLLRHVGGEDTAESMLITGTVMLMPGIGFILSAGATWAVAHRLGLMPDNPRLDGSNPR
ncbi:MAG TPA: hypothetical protein VME23_12360 [Terracidiphilus sp.]|nr:hypothetical protein [Terracidiphilus sp.]